MGNRTAAVRLVPALVARLDRASKEMSRRSFDASISRGEALRAAVDRGIDILEKDLDLPPYEPPLGAPRPWKKRARPLP